jgi:hypothetical protein
VCRVNSGAYFPVPELPKAGSSSAVNPTPGTSSSSSSYVYGMRRPPPGPILPPASSSGYVSLSMEEDYGPATAPYPPTAPLVAGGEYLPDDEAAIT